MRQPAEIERCCTELCAAQLFCELSPEQLCRVAALCEEVHHDAGEQLAVESADAYHIFILLQGEVSISKQLQLPQLHAPEGLDRILTRLSGDAHPVIGETALLGATKRRASVRCATDCQLYRIDASALQTLMAEDSAIGFVVYKQLSLMLHDRLELANTDVVKLSAALIFSLED